MIDIEPSPRPKLGIGPRGRGDGVAGHHVAQLDRSHHPDSLSEVRDGRVGDGGGVPCPKLVHFRH